MERFLRALQKRGKDKTMLVSCNPYDSKWCSHDAADCMITAAAWASIVVLLCQRTDVWCYLVYIKV